MRFWDTSAVVPLLLAEARSSEAKRLLKGDPRGVYFWATPVEVTSALARREREGSLTRTQVVRLESKLQRLLTSWAEVETSDRLRNTARRLLRSHPLRAADALQLAAAVLVAEESDLLEFVSFDAALIDAASREGLRTPAPSQSR